MKTSANVASNKTSLNILPYCKKLTRTNSSYGTSHWKPINWLCAWIVARKAFLPAGMQTINHTPSTAIQIIVLFVAQYEANNVRTKLLISFHSVISTLHQSSLDPALTLVLLACRSRLRSRKHRTSITETVGTAFLPPRLCATSRQMDESAKTPITNICTYLAGTGVPGGRLFSFAFRHQK